MINLRHRPQPQSADVEGPSNIRKTYKETEGSGIAREGRCYTMLYYDTIVSTAGASYVPYQRPLQLACGAAPGSDGNVLELLHFVTAAAQNSSSGKWEWPLIQHIGAPAVLTTVLENGSSFCSHPWLSQWTAPKQALDKGEFAIGPETARVSMGHLLFLLGIFLKGKKTPSVEMH